MPPFFYNSILFLINKYILLFLINFSIIITLGGDILFIDLIKLKNGIEDKVVIDEKLQVSEDLLEKAKIISLENVKVEGEITRNSNYDFYVSLDIYGTMILPCSISLKPTNYDFSIKIDENLLILLEEIDEHIKKV